MTPEWAESGQVNDWMHIREYMEHELHNQCQLNQSESKAKLKQSQANNHTTTEQLLQVLGQTIR